MTFASGARSGAGSAAFGWLLPAHLRPSPSKNMVLHIGTGASRRSLFSSHGEFPAESKVANVKTQDTVKIVMTLHLRKHTGFLFFSIDWEELRGLLGSRQEPFQSSAACNPIGLCDLNSSEES